MNLKYYIRDPDISISTKVIYVDKTVCCIDCVQNYANKKISLKITCKKT